MTQQIQIPPSLLPSDGRFGSGPSRVRSESLVALTASNPGYLGTSHRQAPVRNVVAAVRAGLSELFSLPDGYEIVLGNGGSTAFWDAACFGLILKRSQHTVFGEFSSKFADAARSAPWLDDPEILEAPTGQAAYPKPSADVDTYALIQNETSTGVAVEISRPDSDGLVVVDATSGAGGMRVNASDFDVYYFAPQKCFASDGGLWLAACSPRALDRIGAIDGTRYIPTSLDLAVALDNSTKNQTYNTPALATLLMLRNTVDWMLTNGGLEFAASRCEESSEILYKWAESATYASPYVTDPAQRSPVVVTIDFSDEVNASTLAGVLRKNGIVDVDSYRKLARNQLRIGVYPAVEPADVRALVACIEFVVQSMGGK